MSYNPRENWADAKRELQFCSGIYIITNLITKDCYIGAALDLWARIHRHESLLRNNNHGNIYLQRAYNKYDAQNFEFDVVCFCFDEKDLGPNERLFLKFYAQHGKPWPAYNHTDQAWGEQGGKTAAPIEQIDLQTGAVVWWPGAKEAGRALGIPNNTIRNTVRGVTKTTSGFHFRKSEFWYEDRCPKFISNEELESLQEICSRKFNIERRKIQSANQRVVRIGIESGEVEKTYEFLGQTADDGFYPGQVSDACQGEVPQSGDFVWQFESKNPDNYLAAIERARAVRPKRRKQPKGKKIVQLNPKTRSAVATYNRLADVKTAGFLRTAVSSCCQMEKSSYTIGGFIWCYEGDEGKALKRYDEHLDLAGKEDLERQRVEKRQVIEEARAAGLSTNGRYVFTDEIRAKMSASAAKAGQKRMKPIERIDPKTGEIRYYVGAVEAVAEGFESHGISRVVKGIRKMYAGYGWRYAAPINKEVENHNSQGAMLVAGSSNEV